MSTEAPKLLERLLRGEHLDEPTAGELLRTLARGELNPALAGAPTGGDGAPAGSARTDSGCADRVGAALHLVGLPAHGGHRPAELSGGQQQRVAIARALVADPTLLVCDEPTGDLDRATAGEILEILQLLNRDFGKTIVMVTHDPAAAKYAKLQLHLDKGEFVEKNLSSQEA